RHQPARRSGIQRQQKPARSIDELLALRKQAEHAAGVDKDDIVAVIEAAGLQLLQQTMKSLAGVNRVQHQPLQSRSLTDGLENLAGRLRVTRPDIAVVDTHIE